MGPAWAILGRSWAFWGPLGAVLGLLRTLNMDTFKVSILSPSWAIVGCLLGFSFDHLGALLGRLRALLELFWGFSPSFPAIQARLREQSCRRAPRFHPWGRAPGIESSGIASGEVGPIRRPQISNMLICANASEKSRVVAVGWAQGSSPQDCGKVPKARGSIAVTATIHRMLSLRFPGTVCHGGGATIGFRPSPPDAKVPRARL